MMVQIHHPDPDERLEDVEFIPPPRDRWPDRQLKRDAARGWHFLAASMAYLAALALIMFAFAVTHYIERNLSTPLSDAARDQLGFSILGGGAALLVAVAAYGYTKLGWKRFPLTMLMIPAPFVLMSLISWVFA